MDLIFWVAFANPLKMIKKVKTCASNPYVELMYETYKDWAYDEEATCHRGQWRQRVFAVEESRPLDLEIGTGNGTHFAYRTKRYPERCIVGLELKYKTLVQSIRRVRSQGCENARMLRFPAEQLETLFSPGEIDNVFIFFPDPWPKRRQQKNRLIQLPFLKTLHSLMRTGSYLEFKTDDRPYFLHAMEKFRGSAFEVSHYTEDLHRSFRRSQNFKTQFELLFEKKEQPIMSCRLNRL